jgi:symplekin
MPKLIQLSPGVVKEVFTRLLGTSNSIPVDRRPLSAVDLLIALHNIDLDKKDKQERDVLVAYLRKAIDICFNLKQIYSTKVLTIALQQLLDQPGIPLLLMRTIIQVLKHYPKLIEFVINSLQKLIPKQVWKHTIIWDGFIKCCKETIPQSYSVMLQLPPNQLNDFLNRSPNLREPLLEHVQAFTEAQRRHISANTMSVLYDVNPEGDIVPATKQEDNSVDVEESTEYLNPLK